MNRSLYVLVFVVAASSLSACGQKGPLYLPTESQQEKVEQLKQKPKQSETSNAVK